jgi:isoleucyl-tRNA synthetase
VITHGFTVDASGHKMSKSLGNVVAPEQIIKTLGADVLRLWVAATDYRGELHVSEEILKRTSDTYRRIRNTARFLLANLHDFDPAVNLIANDNMLALDQWIVARAAQLQQEILTAYEHYQPHVITQKIHNFCVDDLGSFYLDIIKDRQYTGKKDGIPRRSAQTAIYHVAEALVRWIAPILSFTAEEIWQAMPGHRAQSVLLTDWYKIGGIKKYSKQSSTALAVNATMNNEFWEQILVIRGVVNKEIEKLRDEGTLGSALEAEVDLFCDKDLYQLLSKLGEELRFVFITSAARVHDIVMAPLDVNITELAGLKLKIAKSQNEKCERCWHRSNEVNLDPKFPGICKRCITNLEAGEKRLFA